MATLLQYLTQTGTSQRAMAARVGISKTHMNEIARGLKSPSLKVALGIHKATGGKVPLASLVSPSSDAPSQRKAS